MSNLIDNILNKNLNEAKKSLNEALNEKALNMLEEIKKMLAAEQFTSLEEEKSPRPYKPGFDHPTGETVDLETFSKFYTGVGNKVSELSHTVADAIPDKNGKIKVHYQSTNWEDVKKSAKESGLKAYPSLKKYDPKTGTSLEEDMKGIMRRIRGAIISSKSNYDPEIRPLTKRGRRKELVDKLTDREEYFSKKEDRTKHNDLVARYIDAPDAKKALKKEKSSNKEKSKLVRKFREAPLEKEVKRTQDAIAPAREAAKKAEDRAKQIWRRKYYTAGKGSIGYLGGSLKLPKKYEDSLEEGKRLDAFGRAILSTTDDAKGAFVAGGASGLIGSAINSMDPTNTIPTKATMAMGVGVGTAIYAKKLYDEYKRRRANQKYEKND